MTDINPPRKRPARDAWRRLTERPHLPLVAYLGFFGVVALIRHDHGILPTSLEDQLPMWLVFGWTLCIAAGGVGATVGVLTGQTRIESSCLGFLAAGAAIYGACITTAAWPQGATVLAVVSAIVSTCFIRISVLSRARKAQRVAQRLSDEGE